MVHNPTVRQPEVLDIVRRVVLKLVARRLQLIEIYLPRFSAGDVFFAIVLRVHELFLRLQSVLGGVFHANRHADLPVVLLIIQAPQCFRNVELHTLIQVLATVGVEDHGILGLAALDRTFVFLACGEQEAQRSEQDKINLFHFLII